MREEEGLGKKRGHAREVHATLNTRRKPFEEKAVKKKKAIDLATRKPPGVWRATLCSGFQGLVTHKLHQSPLETKHFATLNGTIQKSIRDGASAF